jgi:hypothetical protein
MNIDGSNQHPITDEQVGHFFQHPNWSPDGTRIAFTLFIDDGQNGSSEDIWVMDADGSDRQNLTSTPDHLDDHPAWSPDGQRIAFHRNRIANNLATPQGDPPGDTWTMAADGTDQHNVSQGAGSTSYDNPTWQPLPIEPLALAWGDTNCDAVINARDAFDILANEAGLEPTQPPGDCLNIGEPTSSEAGEFPWGDWDCSGTAGAQDALPVLASLGDLPPFGGCPRIGTPMHFTKLLFG